MAQRKQTTGGKRKLHGLYRVRYWNDLWDELEHLRLGEVCMVEVVEALSTWFKERAKLASDRAAMSILEDAVMVTIEEESVNG